MRKSTSGKITIDCYSNTLKYAFAACVKLVQIASESIQRKL